MGSITEIVVLNQFIEARCKKLANEIRPEHGLHGLVFTSYTSNRFFLNIKAIFHSYLSNYLQDKSRDPSEIEDIRKRSSHANAA
jgi:hypothetical protein